MASNLTSGICPQPYGQGGRKVYLPLTTSSQVWQGAMVAESAAGAIVTATTAGSGPVVGIAEMDAYGAAQVDGTDDSLRVSVLYDRIFLLAAGTNPPTDATPLGTMLYCETDNTVGLGGGANGDLFPAGVFMGLEDNGSARVMINPAGLATVLASGGSSPAQAGQTLVCRAVLLSLPETYTNVAGVLTAGTHSALGTQDGVTLAVGDLAFLPAGATNSAAATDEGPYVVTALGAAGAYYVLTRAPGWETGTVLPEGARVRISEGTVYAGTTWKSFAVKGSTTIDTNDPAMYPESVTVPLTLSTGFATQLGIPIRSLTKSGFSWARTNFSGGGSTVHDCTGAIANGGAATAIGRVGTAGSLTQASVSVTALVAAGTYNTSDGGTLLLTITN